MIRRRAVREAVIITGEERCYPYGRATAAALFGSRQRRNLFLCGQRSGRCLWISLPHLDHPNDCCYYPRHSRSSGRNASSSFMTADPLYRHSRRRQASLFSTTTTTTIVDTIFGHSVIGGRTPSPPPPLVVATPDDVWKMRTLVALEGNNDNDKDISPAEIAALIQYWTSSNHSSYGRAASHESNNHRTVQASTFAWRLYDVATIPQKQILLATVLDHWRWCAKQIAPTMENTKTAAKLSPPWFVWKRLLEHGNIQTKSVETFRLLSI
jgi:hypothetical protein